MRCVVRLLCRPRNLFYGRHLSTVDSRENGSSCRILRGREISRAREAILREAVHSASSPPSLAVVLVGHNAASEVYVRNKQLACNRVGISFKLFRLNDSIRQEHLVQEIHRLNNDPSVHGVIVQLPLPEGIDANEVCSEVLPIKDVDCFTPENVGRLCHGNPLFLPCAPKAVLTLLEEAHVPLQGMNALMIGRSNVVGQPLSMMLGHRSATVAMAHSRTPPSVLKDLCRWAEIVVSATGVARLVRGEMVRPGAVVIDVGISRLSDGSIVGDVDFEEVRQVASVLTPVPGGVGPLTVVSLLENTVLAHKLQTS